MSKSLYDKKVNRNVKRLNRQLLNDVFGDRFWARQVQKSKADGIEYYLYELCDREQPERNELVHGWLNYWEICSSYKIWEAMNNFIITSDFWTKYNEARQKSGE